MPHPALVARVHQHAVRRLKAQQRLVQAALLRRLLPHRRRVRRGGRAARPGSERGGGGLLVPRRQQRLQVLHEERLHGHARGAHQGRCVRGKKVRQIRGVQERVARAALV
jgi:hypothetical protein